MRARTSALLFLLTSALLVGVSLVVAKTEAPDFTLPDIYGTEFSLSDYRGKVVLIDLFRIQPSCPPCIYAIPHLKGVYDKYSQNDLVMMSISVSSIDTDENLRNDFVEEYDIPWIVACGGTQIASKYSVSAVPTLVIVDAEGYVGYRHEGVTE
jgi:peroxiredoxin